MNFSLEAMRDALGVGYSVLVWGIGILAMSLSIMAVQFRHRVTIILGNFFGQVCWVLYFLLYNFVIGHELVYISLPLNFKLSTLNYEICLTPHILTFLIVFPITLLTGFWLNRNITFTQSSLRGYKQLWRYILIVALNLLVNYLGLKLCVDILSFYPTPSKMLITLVTVAISFFGQKYFSFKQ